MQTIEFESWRGRHAELLREAEEERLARRLRKNGRRERNVRVIAARERLGGTRVSFPVPGG